MWDTIKLQRPHPALIKRGWDVGNSKHQSPGTQPGQDNSNRRVNPVSLQDGGKELILPCRFSVRFV